ncbi:hypothetical protein ABFK62_03090 [Acinetobacter baumannii]|uniref:hypothetical protein n=1 Tax=Acinetobacter baumannii TaxID=470 RepID=UPI0009A938FA|nr:hypothetical protein [Acinetobacter baumannii]MBZ0484694.1 hypothetical protein [Acinetobacter baumannii]HCT9561378.1 hypothetical protein [Acinetobacter baumannii]
MDKFMLEPLQESYSFTPGNNIREQENEGGPPRQSPFFVGAVHRVGVTVYLENDEDRQYFWAFWRLKQRKPEDWLWNLALDEGVREDCECRFAYDFLPSESYRNGQAVKMSFQVIVKPIKRSADLDRNIVNVRQGFESMEVVDDIEKVPNEWLPDALGVNQ